MSESLNTLLLQRLINNKAYDSIKAIADNLDSLVPLGNEFNPIVNHSISSTSTGLRTFDYKRLETNECKGLYVPQYGLIYNNQNPNDYLGIGDWSTWTNPTTSYTNNSGKIIGVYYSEWSMYERKYNPKDLPLDNITHIYYAFIGISGTIDMQPRTDFQGKASYIKAQANKDIYSPIIVDPYASIEYPNFDSDGARGRGVNGVISEFYRIKKKFPNKKIIASIGGWSLSDPFFYLVRNPCAINKFIENIKAFLNEFDVFDGIDFDFEFPGGQGLNPYLGDTRDGIGYTDLVFKTRKALDDLGTENNRYYELSAAIGVSIDSLKLYDMKTFVDQLDSLNLMTYDFYGAWNTQYGFNTMLYSHPDLSEQLSVDYVVNYIADTGADMSKVAIGVASYARGWQGIQGITGLDSILKGEANGGTGITNVDSTWSLESGTLDYTDIKNAVLGTNYTGINGFTVGTDPIAKAGYAYNVGTGTFVTYDSKESTIAKGQYVIQNGLKGLFTWEASTDKTYDILNSMNIGLGNT